MNILKLFNVMQGMASLARYSQTRLAAPENVLEHTGFVVLACYFITQELNSVLSDNDEYYWKYLVCITDVLNRAIIHDVDELVTGDIPRPTKYASKESVALFDKLKTIGMKKIINELGLPKIVVKDVLNDHDQAKEGRDGAIVALVDLMAVVYKLWDEILVRNNHSMIRQAINVQNRSLPNLYKKLNAFENAFNAEQFLYLKSLLSNMSAITSQCVKCEKQIYGTITESYYADNTVGKDAENNHSKSVEFVEGSK